MSSLKSRRKALKRGPSGCNEQQTGWAERTPGLAHRRDVFGLVVTGNCMMPHYRNGDIAYVEPRRPAVGDIAIIEFKEWAGGHPRRIIKRLVGLTPAIVTCAMYDPPGQITIERSRVRRMYRVIPDCELWPRSPTQEAL